MRKKKKEDEIKKRIEENRLKAIRIVDEKRRKQDDAEKMKISEDVGALRQTLVDQWKFLNEIEQKMNFQTYAKILS